MVKLEEKQMGAEGSGSEEDCDFYNDGLHEMADEEELFYSSHVLKSDKKKGKLEFVKALKAMTAVVAGVLFYITFDAKDLADGGSIKTYQSEVFSGIVETSVLSFRLKPPDFEQANSLDRWKDLCNYVKLASHQGVNPRK
ncbi:hypothetical protein CJ030_MR2G000247 [Morella rubra]|uniref:Uncharacterized protein n=1 Tax=Morella rubra TaxID=262757 RepID=A0A6A1WCU7_9ROSI|nr:hypothetical protein CJ030_MR2G000247 [Morella rubra]